MIPVSFPPLIKTFTTPCIPAPQAPDLEQWWVELRHMSAAARVTFNRISHLSAECKKVVQTAKMVVTPVKRKAVYPNNDGDRFVEVSLIGCSFEYLHNLFLGQLA